MPPRREILSRITTPLTRPTEALAAVTFEQESGVRLGIGHERHPSFQILDLKRPRLAGPYRCSIHIPDVGRAPD